MWAEGDVVAVREVWKGRIWQARPWIVVRDTPEERALWIPAGTPVRVATGSGIPRDEWFLRDDVTTRPLLRISRPGALHGLLHLWEGRRLTEWYVNFERPLRRSRVGFDYLDRELDAIATPDGSWRLLDEDEFEAAQESGAIDSVEAAEIQSEAERVRTEWPFPTGWEDWRPDSAWAIPTLPHGWDAVPQPMLRTERLTLRPLDESDLPWYAALRAPDGFTWRAAMRRHSEALEHWALHGFGKFAVLEAGEPVGVITLNHAGDGIEGVAPSDVDLGWSTLLHRLGEGIAPEAARAVVEWARARGIGPLVVFLHVENAASRRVAEKLGLRLDGEGRSRSGRPIEIYREAP